MCVYVYVRLFEYVCVFERVRNEEKGLFNVCILAHDSAGFVLPPGS